MNGSAAGRKGRRKLRAWHVVVLMLVGGAIAAVVYAGTRTHATVRVGHPTYEDVASTLSSTGMVVPEHDFAARASFTGLVEDIYVHVGEKVRPGQMLVHMKDQYATPRLDKARADLDEAILNEQNVLHNGSREDRVKAQMDLLKAQQERDQAAAALQAMQQISKDGSVSGAELEAATQRLRMAEAGLKAVDQALANRYSPEDIKAMKDRVAEQRANVTAEEVSWRNANIVSPIAGTVYVIAAHLYDFVPAGGDMLHVADLSHKLVRASFEEPDVAKLNKDEKVTITWDGAPGRVWHGHLREKPLAITQSGPRRVAECTIALDGDHNDLPINTNVAVVVSTETHSHVLAIPREALRMEDGKHYVFRVVKGELRRTPVEVGLSSAMTAEITHGLSPDDTIVLHAGDGDELKDGMRVEIAN